MKKLIDAELKLSVDAVEAADRLAAAHGLFSEAMAISASLHLTIFLDDAIAAGGSAVLENDGGTVRTLPARMGPGRDIPVTVYAKLNGNDLVKAERIREVHRLSSTDEAIAHALLICDFISRESRGNGMKLKLILANGDVHEVVDANFGFGHRPTVH